MSQVTTIGDRVKLKKGNNINVGVVRFIGEIAGKHGIFYGIELDNKKGKNNGTINKIQYFKCKQNNGLFVKKISILKTKSKNNNGTPRVTVGDKVKVTKCKCYGIIRFIGTPYSIKNRGIYYGIQLHKPNGKNNGTINGRCYFKCKRKYGIFVQSKDLNILTKSIAPKQKKKNIEKKSIQKY
eukprot:423_1